MQERLLIVIVFVLTVVATASLTMLFGGGASVADTSSAPAAKSTSVGTATISDELIGEKVEQFIINNPQKIVDAFMVARQKQEQDAAAEAERTIQTKMDDIENDPSSPSYGNEKGDIVLVKFNDYNCGFCKRAAGDIEKLYEQDKNIKFVVKEFPILGDQSTKLAKAAIAFNRLNPDNFHDFHASLLKSTPRTDAQLTAKAEEFGVDGEELLAEMESDQVMETIRANLQLGQSIGVSGTPAFVIGGEFVRGAVGLEQMKAIIERARDNS